VVEALREAGRAVPEEGRGAERRDGAHRRHGASLNAQSSEFNPHGRPFEAARRPHAADLQSWVSTHRELRGIKGSIRIPGKRDGSRHVAALAEQRVFHSEALLDRTKSIALLNKAIAGEL
jgi:hypothetical protein